MKTTTGKLDIRMRAADDLHHGAGAVGNTQVFRTQRIYSSTIGDMATVPFVSGNSLKHMLRDGGVRFALDYMGVESGTLSKGVVHLLFTGGSLTKSGTAVNLQEARELERLFPMISLCGYAAGNVMLPSKLKVDHLHLVCRDNAWRMPDDLVDAPEAKRRASEYRGEAFGTRHEPTRTSHTARCLVSESVLDADAVEASKAAYASGPSKMDSLQMYYEWEVIQAGSLWWGAVFFDQLTDLELSAFRSALAYSARGKRENGIQYHVGGKSAVGFGRMLAEIEGSVKHADLDVPEYTPVGIDTDGELGAYVSYLQANKNDILELLLAVTK